MLKKLLWGNISKGSLFLLVLIAMTSMLWGQLKEIETSYLQLPVEGIKYQKVEVFVTLDQSASRDMLGKFGAIGKAASAGVKDITEVYDTWSLVPFFIKTDNVGKGALRLDVTYSCDDLRRPMGTPAKGNRGFVVPYKVYAKVKVTDPAGKVIYDRNYGVLSGTTFSHEYVEAVASKDGVGTYEKACIRGAIAKARAEFFGRYGFGSVQARLDLGPVPDIKDTKKAFDSIQSIFKGRTAFALTSKEKEKVQAYAELIEKNISSCKDKTRWIAFHNLAVCYAWLENAPKAKEYLTKEYAESKVSIDKVLNFSLNRKGGYTGTDGDKYEAYTNIEEFVNYYPAAATKYHSLLVSLSRPLKQLVDFYANNDLLCQIFGIDYMYDFFPFQKYNTNPKKVTTTITQEGQNPIIAKLEFDKAGRIEVVRVEAKNDEGKTIETKKLVVSYNDDGSYKNITAKTLFTETSNNNLRYWEDPLVIMTKGVSDGILDDGILGGNSSETVQLRFDMQGKMFITGKSSFSNPDPILKRFISDKGFKFFMVNTKTEYSALTNINENGVIDISEWDGTVDVSWGVGAVQGSSDYIKAKITKDHKVTKFGENKYPSSISYNYSSKASFKSEKMNWKGLGDRFKSYDNLFNEKISTPKVTANSFELQKTQNWPCEYKLDAKGNWTNAKIGSTLITREIKY